MEPDTTSKLFGHAPFSHQRKINPEGILVQYPLSTLRRTLCLTLSLSINMQLHTLVSDEACYKVMEHYTGFVEQLAGSHLRAESRVGMEASYQKAVESLLGDDNCFKIILVSDF